MIDWISVDDVLYRWNGQEIVCETDIGYSTYLDGGQLDGLEITDSEGDVLGLLFVDFVVGSLSYESFDEQSPDNELHYSIDGYETVIAFSQLPAIISLHDVAVVDSEDTDLWLSIANLSQIHVENTEDVNHTGYIDASTVLDYYDNSLDSVLQKAEGLEFELASRPLVYETQSISDMLHFNSILPDPLDIFKIG